MTIIMDDTQIATLEQIKSILGSSKKLLFKGLSREGKYGWIESVLKRFDYFRLGKKEKGLVKAYLERMSGLSRAQMTRLVSRKLQVGSIKPSYEGCHRIAAKYTIRDHELLAHTDKGEAEESGQNSKRPGERTRMRERKRA